MPLTSKVPDCPTDPETREELIEAMDVAARGLARSMDTADFYCRQCRRPLVCKLSLETHRCLWCSLKFESA